MKQRTTRTLLQTVALAGAMAAGTTAFGDYWNDWSAGEGSGYWEDASSWTYGTVADGTLQWRVGYDGAAVKFKTAAAPEAGELHLHGGAATFTADASETDVVNGLTIGIADVGVWYGSAATAEFTSGAYNFTTLNVGRWSNAGTVNINGGTVYAGTIWNGVTNGDTGATTAGSVTLTSGELKLGAGGIFSDPAGTFTIAGGTLTATASTEWLVNGTAMVVNGGTINTDYDVTIPSALTGSGTLTKTGTGTLTITGSISAFKGKIAVAAGAGSVIVGDVTIAAGEEVQFGAYVWTGAGTAVEPEEEGGETTYINKDLWSNVNNWLVNNAVPTAPPAADSVVVIPEGEGELTIKCAGASDYTGYLTINRNVKLTTKGGNEGIVLRKVDGTGTLTLQGGGSKYFQVYPVSGTAEFEIDCNLNIEYWVYFPNRGSGTEKWSSALTLKGALSGDGNAKITCNTQAGQPGIKFYGDTSNFKGSYSGGSRSSGARDGTEFCESARGSADASWEFGSDLSSNAGYSPFNAGDNVTYKFGQLNTIFDGYNRLTFETYHKSLNSDYASNVTVEVGGKANSTSTVGGAINGTNNKIVKVGTTSTLNFTASESVGTVEAKEGTTVILGTVAPAAVKFAGTGATIKIANTVGTYETQTIVDTPAVEDDPTTTDVDESTPAVTHEETVQTAGFAPGLCDELANCQIAADTTTEEGYTIYTLAKVATAGETQYYTVADAFAALAEAEDKTVTLIRDTTEAVVIPTVGYKFAPGEFAHGAVSGAAGVAVSESEGVFTGVANTAATWTNAGGDNLWLNPLNWSTKSVPVAETTITLPDGAVLYTDTTGLLGTPVAAIVVNGAATLTRDATASDYTAVGVVGNVTGEGTLTLNRCGLNGCGSATEINCNLAFENTTAAYALEGFDSYLQDGSFTVNGNTTGSGLLRLYAPTVFNGSVTLDNGTISGREGSVPTFNGAVTLTGKSYIATYATAYNGAVSIGSESRLALGSTTQNYGEGFSLTGTGTIIGDTQMPSGKMLEDINDETKWQGTLEALNVSLSATQWFGSWGNPSSTVRANKLSMPLYGNSNTTGDHNIKALEVVNDGLSVSGQYSTSQDFVLPFDISGSGKMYFDMKGSGKKNVVFTGDVSNFTGMFHYPNSTTVNTRFVFGSTEREFENKSVVVGEGKTVTVGTAWTAPGNIYVDGTLTIAAVKPFNYGTVFGAGKVVATTLPTTNITFGEGWTGEFVIKAGGPWRIPAYGSTVVFGSDVSGYFVNGDGNGPATSGAAIRLDANATINNGWASTTAWPANTTKITGLSGTGNLAFTWTTGTAGAATYYEIVSVGDYSGTISVGSKSNVKIDGVDVESVPLDGSRLVSLGTSNMTQFFNADAVALSATDPAGFVAVTVEGQPDEAKLFLGTDGLYVAVAKVGDDYYASYATAAAAAVAATQEGDTPSFTVVYGNGVLNGWDYDPEADTLTKNAAAIARVGTTNYDTLADAFAAAGEDDTVVLFGTSAEAVTLGSGQTLEIAETAAYTGTLSGSGTVDAYVATTPAGFSDWTGTFVVNWDLSGTSSSKAAVVLDNYGVSGSSVRVMKAIENFYFRHKDKANSADVQPAVYFEADVTQNDGYTYNYNGGLATIFSQVGMAAGKTFATRGAGGTGNKYIFTKLEGFEGTLNVRNTDIVEINGVELAETPAVGTKVVNATAAATASVTAKIADGYPLVLKDDGLYFDPVAQVGEAYYNTLADAIAAANGAVVTLVQSTEEGYTFTGDGTVRIQFNGQTCGTIAAPEGAYVFTTSWQEATTTATYTCRAAVASASIGGVVTYYSTVQDAYFAVNANGSVGDSFTVLDGSFSSELEGYEYNAETATYTKVATVAQFMFGVQTYSFTTLASACTEAEVYDPIPTVTLLVARESIEEATPEGWEYNTPEASETEFGTLTKEVTNTYTVPAEAALGEGGTLTVPEGTTTIKIGSYDVTTGFTVSGTTATLVAPALAETVAEADDAFVVGTSDVTLNATLVPGLYYGVGSATSLNELARPAALTQFTGENGDACKKVTKPEGGKGFFRLYVDIKE